ncbi:MAG: DedA family protein [Acidimicrobiales bacterium]
MSIHHLIVTYGYLAVFLLVAIESFGVPLPGETAVITAATYAGATHSLSVWVIFLLAALGAVLGDTGGYWIGNKGGYRLLRRWGHYVRFDEPKLKAARYLFERHGGKVVFFGRFVSILRTYAAFLAGTARMHYGRFLTWNASGGILWAAVYSFGAYFAGSTLASASTPVAIGLGVAAVVLIVAALLLVRGKTAELMARAEAMYPGPLEP